MTIIRIALRTFALGMLLLIGLPADLPKRSIAPKTSSQFTIEHNQPDPREERENCRLLGIVSRRPQPVSFFEDVLYRFRSPRYHQNNGWSLSAYSEYFDGGRLSIPGFPQVFRSERDVQEDTDLYDQVSAYMLRIRPTVLIGHLRNASSGCAQVADPHPFQRFHDGKHWLFIHNGGVWGADFQILEQELLGGHYIPENCPDYPIDSELLFVYLLKLMDEHDLPPFEACKLWGGILLKTFGSEWNALNIILTDGETLWAVRCSYADNRFLLNYQTYGESDAFAVTTEILDHGWQDIGNMKVAEFQIGRPPRIEELPLPSPVEPTGLLTD